MPAPSVYTEHELAVYMLSDLGRVGDVLEFTPASMIEAVYDAILAYGVDDISEATDIARLRVLARVAAWQKAAKDAATFYDFVANDARFQRSQLYRQIRDGLTRAQNDAAALGYLVGYVVKRGRFSITPNPYYRGVTEDGD